MKILGTAEKAFKGATVYTYKSMLSIYVQIQMNIYEICEI